jgi:uncharacterized protein
MAKRPLILEHVMQPGTGKAFELRRGQVMRIEQIEDGAQCADSNFFNLNDYKEFFHAARTRHLHGMNPTVGDFLWSAPPRERPMAAIVADTVGENDVFYPRCSAFLYEYHYGLPVHTSCADILAEAIREYGLTPDDVHDSFNWFVNTGFDASGHPFLGVNHAKIGDYVEILALIDLLAVPNVCGADVMATSNFKYKPLKVSIFRGSEKELAHFTGQPLLRRFATQRTPRDFKNSTIKPDRELRRDPNYRPDFLNVPIILTDVAVSLPADEQAMLDQLQQAGLYGKSTADALRYIFHSWWINRFMEGPKHFKAPE